MQSTTQLHVTGLEKVQRSGVSKAGVPYSLDWVTVHYYVDLYDSDGGALGRSTATIQLEGAENIEKFKSCNFPLMCKAVIRKVKQGQNTIEKLESLTPIQAQK